MILFPMSPEDSLAVFRERLRRADFKQEALQPSEVLAQMLSFYREVRADKCDLEAEGDMLLFEWGNHDTEDGDNEFFLDFTRQFILDGDEDEDGMSQLYVRLHYPSTEELQRLGEGNHWCEHPDQAAAFEEYILASEAYRAVVALKPQDVIVDWSLV